MRKRLLSAILLFFLLLSLSLPTLAAGSMDHFTAVRDYDDRFSDVTPGAWYYDNVTALYELGLTDGQTATHFGAQNTVSLAEAAVFAARIRSTYTLGGAELGPASCFTENSPWYASYLTYLKAEGVLDSRFDSLLTRPATRAQVAYLLSRVLPEEEFDARNADLVLTAHNSGRYIADVTSATPCAPEILSLYRRGIVAGSDNRGTFRPAATITRSELAAMLTRIVDPSLRITPGWDMRALYSARGTGYASFVSGSAVYYPSHGRDDLAAVASNIRYMFKNNLSTLQVQLTGGSVTGQDVNILMEHYLDASMLYPEQCYSSLQYRYSSTGRITLTLLNPNGGDRDAALQRAIDIHDQFWSDGTLHLGMTQREIARVYFAYICEVCDYDYSYSDISRTPYGALYNGLAVCQGYTGAYNLFLKLEGIPCASYSLNDHIWTTATLDGIPCHLDTTWGDQSWGIDETYFCMTPEDAVRLHS